MWCEQELVLVLLILRVKWFVSRICEMCMKWSSWEDIECSFIYVFFVIAKIGAGKSDFEIHG